MDQVIPLDAAPNQTWSAVVDISGGLQTFVCVLRYNDVAGYWVLTISDSNNQLLLDSVPLVGGFFPAGNLLGQFAYLNIGSLYLMNISGRNADHPDATSLGSDFILVWSDMPKA
jgi:hypothetical protein